MPRTIVGQQQCWDPVDGCWSRVEIYWEDGYQHDLEWLDENCYIRRVDMELWVETSCLDKDRDGNFVVRKRSRQRQQSYVLAERCCKMEVYKVWTEAGALDHVSDTWDVDGEFWRRDP